MATTEASRDIRRAQAELQCLVAENVYGHVKRIAWMLEHIQPADRVLELGCGTGLMIARPLCLLGYDIHGVDLDEPSILQGRAWFREAGLDPERLLCQPLESIEWQADVIIASEVLEHIPDADQPRMFAALRRVLKPDGRLLVTVPNGCGWFELESFWYYPLGLGWLLTSTRIELAIHLVKWLLRHRPDDPRASTLADSPHVQWFTWDSIARLLNDHGFAIQERRASVIFCGPLTYLFGYGFHPWLRFNCWAGDRMPRLAAGFYLACVRLPTSPRVDATGSALGSLEGDHDVSPQVTPSRAKRDSASLTILCGATTDVPRRPTDRVIDALVLMAELLRDHIWPHLRRYTEVLVVTSRLNTLPRPLLATATARCLSRQRATVIDETGAAIPVTPRLIGGHALAWIRDLATAPAMIRDVRRLAELQCNQGGSVAPTFDATPVYLRTDFSFGLKSGGSVSHIAGVLNNLSHYTAPPVFITTDNIPGTRTDLETHVLTTSSRYWSAPELPWLASTADFLSQTRQRISNRPLAFVYQRYSLNNFTGLAFARERHVPFVLEYNGSEVWVAEHWGNGRLRLRDLSLEIEHLNLKQADLIVVVSEPLREELLARGVQPERILVNPNGVEPERYTPEIDGSAVRARYGLQGKTVIGFIGTFGLWHGGEVLADAFGQLLHERPQARDHLRLLLVGDGVRLGAVKARLAQHHVSPYSVLTGVVPQEEGPAYLAAMDVFASPHVPNLDGTKFFGSPTKLFEYMAMGRGIVASDLNQIGEILRHGETAWLVRPGDVKDLARGLQTLIDQPDLRRRLGQQARQAVVARYTWKAHTGRIIQRLVELCPVSAPR